MRQNQMINKDMGTVIQFPESKIRSSNPNLSNDERDKLVLLEKIESIENSLEYVSCQSIGMVSRLGYDITREDMVKDITLIVDAFRSLLYKCSDLPHPVQEFVDNNYQLSDTGDGEYAFNPSFDCKMDSEDETTE